MKRWAGDCGWWAGGNLEIMCAACPQNVSAALSPWTSHCMLLSQMVEAGCHFGPNDLSLEEWLGIAGLRAAIQSDAEHAAKEKQRPAPMIGPP